MLHSDKQNLLGYFQSKSNKTAQVVCNVTGISFKIEEPFLPPLKGLIWEGLSPLSVLDSALQLGRYSYSEAHYNLSPSILAGSILSIFHHYNLRHDKLSAVEANLILSQLPLHTLSNALRFLARLSTHERRRIPHISLSLADSSSLKTWLWAAQRSIDVTIYESSHKEPKLETGRGILDQSVLVETRKEARELLKNLKADSILPLKLETIISISIQGNRLAMIGEELRNNIMAGLLKIGTADCIKLAEIFKTASKNLTNQESITKQIFETSWDSASDSFTPKPKKTLYEIIAEKKAAAMPKKEKTQAEIAKELLAMIPSIEAEVEEEAQEEHPSDCECGNCYTAEELAAMKEDASVEEEFLEDHESLEAIQAEAEIEELFVEQMEFSAATQEDSLPLDIDSLPPESDDDFNS